MADLTRARRGGDAKMFSEPQPHERVPNLRPNIDPPHVGHPCLSCLSSMKGRGSSAETRMTLEADFLTTAADKLAENWTALKPV